MTAVAQDGSSCGRCVVGLPFNEATFSNESLSNETPCATWYLYGSTFSYSFEGKAAIFPQLLVTKKEKKNIQQQHHQIFQKFLWTQLSYICMWSGVKNKGRTLNP